MARNCEEALETAHTNLEKDAMLTSPHALMGEIHAARDSCYKAVPAFRKALEIDADTARTKEGIERRRSREA